jgi:hypothetical protein
MSFCRLLEISSTVTVVLADFPDQLGTFGAFLIIVLTLVLLFVRYSYTHPEARPKPGGYPTAPITSYVTIDKSSAAVWNALTRLETWAQWWSKLESVSPSWGQGAILHWAQGEPSRISCFKAGRKMYLAGPSVEVRITLWNRGDSTLVGLQERPIHGAKWNDGGVSRFAPQLEALRKLKGVEEGRRDDSSQPDTVLKLFMGGVWGLAGVAAFFGLLTFMGIPSLSRAIRLMNLGRTSPIVIADGYSHFSYFGPQGGSATTTKARVSGDSTEFFADRLYHKGDQAFLTYSDRLRYGVITSAQPKSLFDILNCEENSRYTAVFAVLLVSVLTLTNLLFILLAVLEHAVGLKVPNRFIQEPGGLGHATFVGSSLIEALLATTLSFVPIAAALAAFSISLKIQDASPWTMCIIYVALLLFLGSHVTAGVAIGLLRFLRSKFGHGLKKIVAYGGSLAVSLDVVVKVIHLTFSDRAVHLSNWWQVAKEFCRALFGL